MLDYKIHNVLIVTFDHEDRVIRNGKVGIRGNKIELVSNEGSDLLAARATIDGSGMVLIPGLINAHTHSLHNLMRGGPSDGCKNSLDWLTNALDPVMREYT